MRSLLSKYLDVTFLTRRKFFKIQKLTVFLLGFEMLWSELVQYAITICFARGEVFYFLWAKTKAAFPQCS